MMHDLGATSASGAVDASGRAVATPSRRMLPEGLVLVLASASPRRRELLGLAGLEAVVDPADIDETRRPGESPAAYVERLARDKADAVRSRRGGATAEVIVAADTTVALDGEALEKPVDADDARRMLRRLSGRIHACHTGVAVVVGADAVVEAPDASDLRSASMVVTTNVTFTTLGDAEIEWYLATGEPFDKAGAYGIQGSAAGFVERVDGSVTNVIGLPVAETIDLIRRTVGGRHEGPR